MKKYVNVMFLCFVVLSILLLSKGGYSVMSSKVTNKQTIVIDAGHGGFDPGKVGTNKALEKTINLSIALKLQTLLEQNDFNVIMIRTTDVGLYTEGSKSKKAEDMRNRVKIINESDAIAAVSIHQNSYPSSEVKGAQVFYHQTSTGGKVLAEIIQEELKTTLQDGNKRVAKSNENYYMLKKTQCPLVIVECGFLSNPTEAELLNTNEYQDKIAWAIHLGVLKYVNQLDG